MTDKLKIKSHKRQSYHLVFLLFSFFLSLFPALAEPKAGNNDMNSQQQRITVSGVVKDNSGAPLIGAGVFEKGTTNGTVTDKNGAFQISIHENSILVVSNIGFVTKEINVKSSGNLDIVLEEDLQALDEIIVIGYGTAKRRDFTGSVSSVRLENSPIALTANQSALESLKGNVAGLDIGYSNTAGASPSMQMRGQKSISGSNTPLIVVDGVIYLGSLNNINPDDIASIDVLKDATSAAAYGSRSANGVIVITTKKGRSDKPVIRLNAYGSYQRWQNRPKLMKADQWLESVMARNNSTDLSWLTAQEVANREAGKETNWLDVATRKGYIQDYQLSVSGASQKVNYYLSTSYTDNKAVVKGNDFTRFSVLSKIDTDIASWLNVGFDGAFTYIDYSGVEANLSTAVVMSPYGVVYRDEEKKLPEKYPQTQSQVNPIWGIDDGTQFNLNKRYDYRINAHALVKIPWVDGLSFRINYSGDLYTNKSGHFYYETNFVREGAYDDASRYSSAAYQNLLSKARGDFSRSTQYSWVVDNILTYKKTFNKHSIEATAVATRDRTDYHSKSMSGSDFAANGNTTLGINGLHKATTQKISMGGWRKANIGYFGRLSYSYDEKYFFTASYRRDGASVFGANKKWGNFYAFGGAWNITQETFMKNVNFLNNLKVKLSWGKNGNQGLNPYGTLSTVVNSSDGGIRYEFGNSSEILYGIALGALGNDDLGWESTEAWNTGFESSWLNNRLTVDMDLYFSQTKDQIFTRNIPVMTGFKTIKSSMGQVNNHGVELTIHSTNIQNSNFSWNTGVTFWINRNKLKHLYGDDIDGDGKEDDDISNSRFIGKSLGAIYGYRQDGIVQEEDTEYIQANSATPGYPKYKDLDGDGKITSSDREILGYSAANFKLNMSNTLTYKNLSLYVMVTGTFGGNGYYKKSNTSAYMINGTGLFNSNGIYIPWWTKENRSNKYPSATFTGDGRFLGLQSRGFVRIQDVTLSYSFNQPWLKSINVSELKLFVTAKNLATFTNWVGGDPEVGTPARINSQPVLSTYSIGVNLSF